MKITPKQGYKLVKSLFSQYEEIPEDWDIYDISNVGEIKGRVGWKGYTQNDFVEKGKGAISLGANSITKDNQLDFRDLTYVTWQKYEESPEIQVSDNDIIIAQRGSIGKVALIHDLPEKTTINPNVVLLKNITSSKLFLYYFLTSFYIQKQMISITSSTTIPLLTQTQIKSFKILIPPILEQQKIASILFNIDSLIQQTLKIVEQTQKLEKGLMQKLLTKGIGHNKFKNTELGKIPENWKISKLSEFSTTYRYPTFYDIDYKSNGIPVLNIGNIDNQNWKLSIDPDNYQKIDEETSKLFPKTIVEENDLVLAVRGATIGKFALVPKILSGSNINANLLKIHLNQNACNPEFFWYFTQTNSGKREFRKFVSYTAKDTVQAGQLKSMKIVLPPILEQQKIASILSNVNSQIQQQQGYKFKLENLKKGLMQKLLTGQIRVKV